jgi:hypothetical protein
LEAIGVIGLFSSYVNRSFKAAVYLIYRRLSSTEKIQMPPQSPRQRGSISESIFRRASALLGSKYMVDIREEEDTTPIPVTRKQNNVVVRGLKKFWSIRCLMLTLFIVCIVLTGFYLASAIVMSNFIERGSVAGLQ